MGVLHDFHQSRWWLAEGYDAVHEVDYMGGCFPYILNLREHKTANCKQKQ